MTAVRPARSATGRPLVALAGVLACWIGARVAVWELPELPDAQPAASFIDLASMTSAGSSATTNSDAASAPTGAVNVALARVALADVRMRADPLRDPGYVALAVPHLPRIQGRDRFAPARLAERPGTASDRPASQPARTQALPLRRWNADLWLALREGSSAVPGGGSVPTYGASQAGAVVRYHLAPASRHDPAAYARVVQVIGRREADLAGGIAARVLPALPITAHVEARASRRGARVDIRPAAFVAAGIDDAALPIGVRARGYAQAGYVGGRDATAFADGSLVAEREALRRDGLIVGVGLGIWGGAQRGASRLDIGPSASVRFALGDGSGRLAVDYRVRVAGNAAPTSGAALTLSAGF